MEALTRRSTNFALVVFLDLLVLLLFFFFLLITRNIVRQCLKNMKKTDWPVNTHTHTCTHVRTCVYTRVRARIESHLKLVYTVWQIFFWGVGGGSTISHTHTKKKLCIINLCHSTPTVGPLFLEKWPEMMHNGAFCYIFLIEQWVHFQRYIWCGVKNWWLKVNPFGVIDRRMFLCFAV